MTQPSILVHQRGTAMLRSALGPAVGALLVDRQVAEVMLNADGKVWVDRLTDSMADTGDQLSA